MVKLTDAQTRYVDFLFLLQPQKLESYPSGGLTVAQFQVLFDELERHRVKEVWTWEDP